MFQIFKNIILAAAILFLFAVCPASAREWDDLYEGERNFYGSEKEEKFPINAYIVEEEKWQDHYSYMFFGFYKETDYPRYTSLRILPFYYNFKSKIDNRERTLWLLMHYKRIDGDDSLTVNPVWYNHVNKGKSDKSILYLFWWGRGNNAAGTWSSQMVIPLLASHSEKIYHSGIRESHWISPLFFSNSKKDINKNQTFEKRSFSLLHYYSSVYSDKGSTTTLSIPIVPLTYHHTSPEGGHRNWFWLFDYSWTVKKNRDELKRFWIAPLWFWKGGSDGYNYILPPVFIYNRWESGEYYLHTLPLFIKWRLKVSGYDFFTGRGYSANNESLISPAFCLFREFPGKADWSGEPSKSTFFFPVIPLYYQHKDSENGTHRNVAWLFDWHKNIADKIDRFWSIPFWFDRYDDNGYRHILPPVYMSFWSRNGEYHNHLLPFYLYKKRIFEGSNPEWREYHSIVLTPVFFRIQYFNNDDKKWDGTPEGIKWWIPAVPLVYRSVDNNEGIHTNVIGLFDWHSSIKGTMTRFWFIPLVFHSTKDAGYRVYLPFYIRPSGNTRTEGTSFGLIHYHNWSPQKRAMWLGPCLNVLEPQEKKFFSMLLPFYFSWKTDKSSAKFVLPVYWDYRYKDYSAKMFLPFNMEYKSRKFTTTVNLLGISRSLACGTFNPELGFDLGTYKDRLYFDTDISWLYDVFSFSTRISFKNPAAGKRGEDISITDLESEKILLNAYEEIAATHEKDEAGRPGLSKKREFDREHSDYFWGWKVLFGWMAYESADTKRHFRLIPLSWFSWDKNSTDRLYTIPILFLYYNSQDEDLTYFAVIPAFSGYQKEKESYRYAFVLNTFWLEYDAEDKQREVTVLWPFINWYSSPKRFGWRFFPLFWHKKEYDDDSTVSRYILFPLHYSRHERDKDDNLINKFVINPFYYSSQNRWSDGESGRTWFPFFLPLYYSSFEKNEYRKAGQDTPNGSAGRVKYTSDEFVNVLYLYMSSEKITAMQDGRKDEDSWFYLLGYYSHETNLIDESSFLFGLYESLDYPRQNKSVFKLLYGLYSSTGTTNESITRLMPFYYNHKSERLDEFYVLLGLYWSVDDKTVKDYDLYVLYGLFSLFNFRDVKYAAAEQGYSKREIAITRWWLIPFYYYEGGSGVTGSDYSRSTHISWLWYYSSLEVADNKYSRRMWFPIIPLIYFHSSSEEKHWNIFGLIDGSTSENYSRFFLLPFFYTENDSGTRNRNVLGLIGWKYYSDDTLARSFFIPFWLYFPGVESELYIPPLLLYFSRSPESSTTFAFGIYLHQSRFYERQNFWYLYDHKRWVSEDRDSFRYFLGTIHYEKAPLETEWDLLYSLLMRYRGYENSNNYKFEFLKVISTWERDGSYFQSSILPIWYFQSDTDRWSLLSPLALSYLSKDRGGDFDLGLLGLVYFRNNDIYDREDVRAVLGGTLYWERSKPERGYHSVGGFWGILWDYETESETGFEKFTILKGLYKRVVMNGEVKNKFLWIF